MSQPAAVGSETADDISGNCCRSYGADRQRRALCLMVLTVSGCMYCLQPGSRASLKLHFSPPFIHLSLQSASELIHSTAPPFTTALAASAATPCGRGESPPLLAPRLCARAPPVCPPRPPSTLVKRASSGRRAAPRPAERIVPEAVGRKRRAWRLSRRADHLTAA